MNKDTLENLQVYTETIGSSLYTVDLLGRLLEDILRFPPMDIKECEYATIAKVLNHYIKITGKYTDKLENFILTLGK